MTVTTLRTIPLADSRETQSSLTVVFSGASRATGC